METLPPQKHHCNPDMEQNPVPGIPVPQGFVEQEKLEEPERSKDVV